MKVSIITATYNSENEIMSTYRSILNQTFTDWEWVITDDCSQDRTAEILNDIQASDSRVRVFRNPVNSGAAVSRNCSISYSQGEFLAFVDSDDLWEPEKLSSQLKFMELEGIDFSFTAYELIDEFGSSLDKFVDLNQVGKFDYFDMLKKKATLGCSTVIIRKAAFKDLSMPLLRTGQDYAFWLKLLKTGKCAYVFNRSLTKYRIRPSSISRNKFRKALRQWEIYRSIERLKLTSSINCFFFYAFRAVFRR